jgi:hypothetical protein
MAKTIANVIAEALTSKESTQRVGKCSTAPIATTQTSPMIIAIATAGSEL